MMRERNRLAAAMDAVRAIETEAADSAELIGLAEAEGDAGMVADGRATLKRLAEEAKRRETESLLSGEADGNDCYMEINAGAGGTEAQDWAEMLMRMYTRWAARLQGHDPGTKRGRAGRAEIGHAADDRAERLWLAEDRGRGAPAGAHQPV
jgi:protein subunit release factor A